MKLISYFLLFVSIVATMIPIWMMYRNVKERLPIIFWMFSFIALIGAIVALVGSFALIYLTEG